MGVNETLAKGREYNFPLSDEAKIAHYGAPCSKDAAYLVDQMHVRVMVRLLMMTVAKGDDREARGRLTDALREVMEYCGQLEREVGDLREAAARAERQPS